jgi:hypothetical protein
LFVNYRLIIYASIIAGMPPPDAFWDFSTVAGFPNRYVITCLFTYYSCICSLDGYICNLSFFWGVWMLGIYYVVFISHLVTISIRSSGQAKSRGICNAHVWMETFQVKKKRIEACVVLMFR